MKILSRETRETREFILFKQFLLKSSGNTMLNMLKSGVQVSRNTKWDSLSNGRNRTTSTLPIRGFSNTCEPK